MGAQWEGGVGSVSKIILVGRVQFLEAIGPRSHFLAGCELRVAVSPIDLLCFYSMALSLQVNNSASNPSC